MSGQRADYWTLALVGLLAAAGCAFRRGPVPDSVAHCRQLAHQSIDAMESGQWGQAERLLAEAIETSPEDVEARRHYAEALAHRGAYHEALAQLSEAIRLDGDDPRLQVRAGELYLAVGDLPRARQQAEEGLDRDIDFGSAWALRGRVMRQAGDVPQALADLHRALERQPNDQQILLEVAELYRMRNQPDRALVALQRLADTYPPGEEPGEVLYLEGLAYLAVHRHAEAAECLYAASVRNGPNAEILYHLAQAEYGAGRHAEAEANLKQVFTIAPEHAPSRQLLQELTVARRVGVTR